MPLTEKVVCDYCQTEITNGGLCAAGSLASFTLTDGVRNTTILDSGERYFHNAEHFGAYMQAKIAG